MDYLWLRDYPKCDCGEPECQISDAELRATEYLFQQECNPFATEQHAFILNDTKTAALLDYHIANMLRRTDAVIEERAFLDEMTLASFGIRPLPAWWFTWCIGYYAQHIDKDEDDEDLFTRDACGCYMRTIFNNTAVDQQVLTQEMIHKNERFKDLEWWRWPKHIKEPLMCWWDPKSGQEVEFTIAGRDAGIKLIVNPKLAYYCPLLNLPKREPKRRNPNNDTQFKLLNDKEELAELNPLMVKRFTQRTKILSQPEIGYTFALPDSPGTWGLYGGLMSSANDVVINRLGAYMIHQNHRFLEEIPEFFFGLGLQSPDVYQQLNQEAFPNNYVLDDIKNELWSGELPDIRIDSLSHGQMGFIGDDVYTRKQILSENFRRVATKLAPKLLEENGIEYYLNYKIGDGNLLEDLLSKVIKTNPIFYVRRYTTHYDFDKTVTEAFYTEIITGRTIKYTCFDLRQ